MMNDFSHEREWLVANKTGVSDVSIISGIKLETHFVRSRHS